MVSGRLSSAGGSPREGANNSTSAPARIQPVTVRLWGSSWPSGLTPCGLLEGYSGGVERFFRMSDQHDHTGVRGLAVATRSANRIGLWNVPVFLPGQVFAAYNEVAVT